MKATDANKLATENKYHDTDRYLEEVFNAILNRSKEGGFSINWYGEIDSTMKNRLEQLGYTINSNWYRGENVYEISWEQIN